MFYLIISVADCEVSDDVYNFVKQVLVGGGDGGGLVGGLTSARRPGATWRTRAAPQQVRRDVPELQRDTLSTKHFLQTNIFVQ